MYQDRLRQRVAGFELSQQLVEVVDVPRSLDLWQHDDVELPADSADNLHHVVQHPGRVQRIDARPQSGRAEVGRFRHLDETAAGRFLGLDRHGVFEIAEDHVDLLRQISGSGPHLLNVRRNEMDHPLDPHRRFAQGRGGADGERFEELAGKLHGGLLHDADLNAALHNSASPA